MPWANHMCTESWFASTVRGLEPRLSIGLNAHTIYRPDVEVDGGQKNFMLEEMKKLKEKVPVIVQPLARRIACSEFVTSLAGRGGLIGRGGA